MRYFSDMRLLPPGSYHHVYNRGTMKMKLFKSPADYCRFMYKMEEYRTFYDLNIEEFCLMPNHFHFLLREPDEKRAVLKDIDAYVISKFMQKLQISYSKYFAIKYHFSGRVFQGIYKSKIIKDHEGLSAVRRYIQENSVRKKLVKTAVEWPYSSASVYRH